MKRKKDYSWVLGVVILLFLIALTGSFLFGFVVDIWILFSSPYGSELVDPMDMMLWFFVFWFLGWLWKSILFPKEDN